MSGTFHIEKSSSSLAIFYEKKQSLLTRMEKQGGIGENLQRKF